MTSSLAEQITERFADTRRRTLEIFDLAEEAVLRESPGFGFRPILWHLAHLGAFEEYWLLNKTAGENPINKRFQIIFDPIKTPRENSKNLPSKAEMLDFLNQVREGVRRVVETADYDSKNPLLRDGYVFDLVHQHELQHQETLAYLFHLLPPGAVQSSKFKVQSLSERQRTTDNGQRTISYESGEYQIGGERKFVYDNELPAHKRFVPAFELDKFLTTVAEFAEFVEAHGYERPEFWSEAGWQFREKENWQHPVYWEKVGGEWRIRLFCEEKSLNEAADLPVYGVSFYEAEAYANFRGKRLPTEFELERAASFDFEPHEQNCNFNFWNVTPVDYFPAKNGAFDLRGNLWEWTTSDFVGYPNFEWFPYPEYSAEWFDGDHKVLRGGSWATSAQILRPTFRNFFRRHFRIAFAGIRLAGII